MATIERIRQRSGLLIVIVFVALMAFVLGDLFRSGGSKLFGDPNVVGSVNGRDVSRQELSQKMEELRAGNPDQYSNSSSIQLANFVWNAILSDEVLSTELEASGMTVSPEEIALDIMSNPNVRQNFANEQGQFDRNMFNSYLSQVRANRDQNAQLAEMWTQWLAFENAVSNQAKNFKFNNAIEKALFMPKALAEVQGLRNESQHPTQYVYVPYIDINEDDLTVTEADAKKYYNSHKDEFSQEAGRNIEYINFQLVPSDADRDAIKAELAGLALEWINVEDDSVFVNLHSDDRFVSEYFTEVELVGTGLDTLVSGQSVGYQKGPIDLGSAYSILKLVDKKVLPDSVEARHILIPFAGATQADQSVTRSPMEAQAIADSLFNYLSENRSTFEAVSDEFSSDIVAKGKGGSLGYFKRGMMAKPFENFCFLNQNGKLGVVPTQFGFHIIEITDQKGGTEAYKVGQITRNILPSDETIQTIYGAASSYAADAQRVDDYRALATERDHFIRPAQNLSRFDEVVPGLGQSRRVVRWAWDEEREEGNIGLLENDGKGYVVVILTGILQEGEAPFELVAEECMEGAKKEAKKALVAEQIEAARASASSIQDLASALGKEVRSLNFRIGSANIAGIGNEAEVVGTICGLEPGNLSEAIYGDNGVFVALTSPAEPSASIDYSSQAKNLERNLRSLVGSQAYKALQDKADIEDLRYMMF
jgi:parvulin-like peptidyl-prolyl isomerase